MQRDRRRNSCPPDELRAVLVLRFRTGDRGAVAIVVAVFAIVAMILLAFVVDRGRIYVLRTQLQNTVDAAALAAVQNTCRTPIAQPGVVRAIAVQYGNLNGVTIDPANVIVQDGPNDASTGVSVAAEQSIGSVFGGFAGVGSSTVAARGSATRLCRTNFQFVADADFWFTSNVTVNAPIFAGRCFNGGSQSTYNAIVAVSTALGSNACAPYFPSLGSDPINLGTSPTIQAGYQPVYDFGLSAATAYSTTWPYARVGATPQTVIPANVGACGTYGGPYAGDISCSGAQTLAIQNADQVGNSDGVDDYILASADITFGNNVAFGTDRIFVYTSSTSGQNNPNGQAAIVLPNSVPGNVFVYAPNGKVSFTGAGSALAGTIFANNVRTSGGGASATAGLTVRFPGPWRLSQ